MLFCKWLPIGLRRGRAIYPGKWLAFLIVLWAFAKSFNIYLRSSAVPFAVGGGLCENPKARELEGKKPLKKLSIDNPG